MEKRVLGQKINKIRKSQKITSEKLAEMCDVNAGHIRQIESGIRLPSLKLLVAICNSLKIKPDNLLSQELDRFDDDQNYDEVFINIVKKLNKLTPEELEMLNSILETYVIKKESVN